MKRQQHQKIADVREHFDEYAATGNWQSLYLEKLNSKNFPFKIRLNWYQDVIKKIMPRSVLDVGCGSGDFIPIIPKATESYCGIDLSKEMVKAASLAIDNLSEGQEKFTVEHSNFMEFRGHDSFDFVLASGFLEYFEDLRPVCSRLFELTSEKGYLAIQVPNREFFRWKGVALADEKEKGFRHHRISGDECDQLMANAGYEKIRGDYINHFYSRYTYIVPRLHVLLDKVLRKFTPRELSRYKASMYCGLYKRLS